MDNMQEPNLNKAYSSTAASIHNLFDRTEEGLVIPAYQREYTWEEDNVNQLFDDLLQGASELLDDQGDKAFSFLGTAILVQPEGAHNLPVVDEERARPTSKVGTGDHHSDTTTLILRCNSTQL